MIVNLVIKYGVHNLIQFSTKQNWSIKKIILEELLSNFSITLICLTSLCQRCKCLKKQLDFIVKISPWRILFYLIIQEKLWKDIWKFIFNIIDSMPCMSIYPLNSFMTMQKNYTIRTFNLLDQIVNMRFHKNMLLWFKVHKVQLILHLFLKENLF